MLSADKPQKSPGMSSTQPDASAAIQEHPRYIIKHQCFTPPPADHVSYLCKVKQLMRKIQATSADGRYQQLLR